MNSLQTDTTKDKANDPRVVERNVRNNKNLILWTIAALLLVVSCCIALWPKSHVDVAAVRIDELSHEIRCPTCRGLSVAESDAPLAVSSRDEIVNQVNAGKSNKEIRAYFIERYGNSALVTAQKHGSGLVPWLMVPAVTIAIALLVFFVVRRWTREGKRSSAPSQVATQKESRQIAAVKQRGLVTVDNNVATSQPTQAKPVAVIGAIATCVMLVLGAGLYASSHNDDNGGVDARTAQVNALLATAANQTAQGKPAEAVRTYDKALKIDPNSPPALAYKGWLIRLAGLPDAGLDSMNKAIAADPNYPDAHFFKGITLLRDKGDPKGAIPEFDAFLSLNPPPAMVEAVQKARAEAVEMSK